MAKNDTFGNRFIDNHSNYNGYLIGDRDRAKEVDAVRLMKLIKACQQLLKKPYIRFMYANYFDEAACIVYDGGNSVTKLRPISEIEAMAAKRKFHKELLK